MKTTTQLFIVGTFALFIAFGGMNAKPAFAAPQFPDRIIGKAGDEPIYATEVLAPIYRKLIQLAASTDKDTFIKQATKVATVRVFTITYGRLVAYDMLRRMPVSDRTLFETTIARHKHDLIKKWGNGDASVADQQLRKDKGIALEQVVRDAKGAMLIQQMQTALAKLVPEVTDKHVDSYFKEHSEKFNVEDQRNIRLIQVEPKDKAAIATALGASKDFAEVAKLPINLFRADRGGDMGEVPGKKIFADEGVNKAALALKEGETSPPITVGEKVWWVHLDKLSLGQSEPTKEQREEIRKQMQTQQMSLFERKYRSQIFQTVPHTKIEEMVLSLQNYLIAIHDNANER